MASEPRLISAYTTFIPTYSVQTTHAHPLYIIMDAVKRFFSSPRFAVAGASADTNKFGYKRGHE